MHVISRKVLRQFWQEYPDSETALIRWLKIIESVSFQSFEELRSVFPNADLVANLIVFNIGGNKYRLIASIHFNRQKVYIRYILTHSEYDKDRWKS
ncbi:type II toxin-antitoxin system HigB family toxin [Dolichospermum circinale CS-1225]|uniref:Type II toxin-antitoxin system HigB family toxin n=1 Tax=Dolichospermum circinale CS-537/01 TaxID=3021739 RepID=A0ABT5AA33_9CYAN|nr:type II toxin-antitoxin system HigB family toxin [Dolichospermum circinale]MDB9488804.1 type II toxin-antitoxin system HigB family toxin [Dolichospermum circinale CS-537/01]MDB9521264.1 type II toxin-antitoxin system HigB family toxin [Dolichospermum circinale CS-1225]